MPSTFDNALAWAESRWEYMPIAVSAALERGWNQLAWQLVAVTLDYVILIKPYPEAYELARQAASHAERVASASATACKRKQ